jgi:transposase InsO family protein
MRSWYRAPVAGQAKTWFVHGVSERGHRVGKALHRLVSTPKGQFRWRNPEANPYIFREEPRTTITSRYRDVAMPWARLERRAVCAERCPYGSGRRSAYALLTPFETDQGWLYLATVMDLYSRKIVGWAMADHLRAGLPLAALAMAISVQRPGAGLIHHSDRGVQYASAEYRKVMQSAGLRASMSRKADCYDNAPMESYFHTLKTELVHHRHYATREHARRDIFAYIEGFYNRTRRHFGCISPIEMELKAA